jgi:hypothetical protein
MSVNVLAVNKPPVADNLIVNTNQEHAATINLPARDVDDVDLTFTVLTAPAHGTLSPLVGNKVIYTPSPRYKGPDSFTFRASDGKSDSNVAVVYIKVAAIKQPPVAVNDAVITAEENAIDINVLANDLVPEQEVLKVIGVTQGEVHPTPEFQRQRFIYLHDIRHHRRHVSSKRQRHDRTGQ